MTREPVAFFNLTEDDLSDENIEAISEVIYAPVMERKATMAREAEEDEKPVGG